MGTSIEKLFSLYALYYFGFAFCDEAFSSQVHFKLSNRLLKHTFPLPNLVTLYLVKLKYIAGDMNLIGRIVIPASVPLSIFEHKFIKKGTALPTRFAF